VFRLPNAAILTSMSIVSGGSRCFDYVILDYVRWARTFPSSRTKNRASKFFLPRSFFLEGQAFPVGHFVGKWSLPPSPPRAMGPRLWSRE